MSTLNAKRHVYQLRAGLEESPADLVGEVTNVVCKVLKHYTDPPGLLDWPDVYLALSRAIRPRLVRYENCGKRNACRSLLRPALWGLPESAFVPDPKPQAAYLPEGVYTLEVRQDLDGFLRALADVVFRQIAGRLAPRGARRELRGHLRIAMERALSPYLFHGAACAFCRERGARERIAWS